MFRPGSIQIIVRQISKYFAARELLGVALILLAALLVFFSPALLTGQYFAPSDIIRILGPTFENGFRPHNKLLSDVLVQFLPWFKSAQEIMSTGHLPLWNIYSGGGLPLAANMQSQVLWPLSIFIYLFNFKLGLFLYAAGKLWLTGFFSYLYLREIGLKKVVALIGGIGFMFAGFNVVWLMWPHTNAVFLLPLGFLLVERYFRTNEVKLLLWFSLAFAIGFFGGHPETFFHIILAVSLYIGFKLFLRRQGLRDFLINGLGWLASGVIGLGLAAALLMPFGEYLRLSQSFAERTAEATNPHFLPKLTGILNFIPDFFGNPALQDKYYGQLINYNETTMGYVGISLLFLALYAILWHRREKLVRFFAILLAFSVTVVYKFPVVFDLVTKLPGFQMSANQRLLLVAAFGAVVLGCLALQKIIESGASRGQLDRHVAKRILLTGAVFAAIVAAFFVLNRYNGAALIEPGKNLVRISTWQLLVGGLFVVNLLVMLIILFRLPQRYRLAGLGILIFLETGLHATIYNTASSQENFYPQTPAVEYLVKEFPNGYYKTFSQGIMLAPNLGTWYGFNQINDNDALGLRSYASLKKKIGNYQGGHEAFDDTSDLNALAFLGAKYLVFYKESAQIILAAHPNKLEVGFEDKGVTILTQQALPRAYFVASAADQLPATIESLLTNPDPNRVQAAESYQLALNGSEEVAVDAPKNGYLILNENYYPGWEAVVNKSSVKVENVLGLRAIPLLAGANTIETFYQPKSLRRGLYISVLSLIAWLGCFFWKRPKRA